MNRREILKSGFGAVFGGIFGGAVLPALAGETKESIPAVDWQLITHTNTFHIFYSDGRIDYVTVPLYKPTKPLKVDKDEIVQFHLNQYGNVKSRYFMVKPYHNDELLGLASIACKDLAVFPSIIPFPDIRDSKRPFINQLKNDAQWIALTHCPYNLNFSDYKFSY